MGSNIIWERREGEKQAWFNAVFSTSKTPITLQLV